VPKSGSRQWGRWPPARLQSMRDMKPYGLFAGMNPGEMAAGTQCNNAPACGTTVAFYGQGFAKAVKVALDIAVSPNPPVMAAEAMRRPWP
jgi:hypothetical protein